MTPEKRRLTATLKKVERMAELYEEYNRPEDAKSARKHADKIRKKLNS